MRKNKMVALRLNTVESNMLSAIAKELGTDKSQVIRALVQMAYADMNTKGGRSVIPRLFAVSVEA